MKVTKAIPKTVDKTKIDYNVLPDGKQYTTDYNIRPGEASYRGLYNTEVYSPEKREYPA